MQAGSDTIAAEWQQDQAVTSRQRPSARLWLDRLGAGMSLACAVHCLALPLMLLFVPAAREALTSFDPHLHGLQWWALWSHELEWSMAALVIAYAGIVLARGWRIHRQAGALRWYAAGSVLLVAVTLEWIDSGSAHGYLLAGGGLLMAWAHLRNLGLLRAAVGRCRA